MVMLFTFRRKRTFFDSPLPLGPGEDGLKNHIFNVAHILASEAVKGFPLVHSSNSHEVILPNDYSSVIVARLSPLRLDDFASYLSAVDRPRPQVMIEARIVEVDRSYAKQIGVNWSGSVKAGNFTGSSVSTFVDTSAFPVTAGLGFLSNSTVLDLELAAMEKGGHGKIISQPRVVAFDKQSARVVKGSQVPYQQSAGDGATSASFKEAALSLDVTPYIEEGGVVLDIKLAKDEPDFANAISGVPPIKTVSLTSRVRAEMGATVALGGVYSNSESVQEHRVPGLASIPYLGRIFRYSSRSSSMSELMLFIIAYVAPYNSTK